MNHSHGNIDVRGLVVRPNLRSSASVVAGRTTGSMLVDLAGFSAAEILITRNGSGTCYSTANSIIIYARHGNTLGAAQVKIPADDLIFDPVGVAGISGAYSADTTAAGTTGRIYTLRTTFKQLETAGVYPTGYAVGSVTLALSNIKVGYKGTRRYLRVGYLSSGACASNTGAGPGYGGVAITVVKTRPGQAPIPVS